MTVGPVGNRTIEPVDNRTIVLEGDGTVEVNVPEVVVPANGCAGLLDDTVDIGVPEFVVNPGVGDTDFSFDVGVPASGVTVDDVRTLESDENVDISVAELEDTDGVGGSGLDDTFDDVSELDDTVVLCEVCDDVVMDTLDGVMTVVAEVDNIVGV